MTLPSYLVQSRATDNANNVETPGAGNSFTYDVTDPEVTLDDIPDAPSSLSSISGTASDTSPGQVDKVQVKIENTTDSTYWDGSDWVVSETWLDATGTTTWSYSMPSLTDGDSYTVQAKSIDKAGNESTIASDSFIYNPP